jgi:hypothetical protein
VDDDAAAAESSPAEDPLLLLRPPTYSTRNIYIYQPIEMFSHTKYLGVSVVACSNDLLERFYIEIYRTLSIYLSP